MKCTSPIAIGLQRVGCGQCNPCRINLRRKRTLRIVGEWNCWPEASFLTFTYADAPYSLQYRDMQLFYKRLRFSLGTPIKHFTVGEYGDRTGRSHFHAAVFGVSCPVGFVVDGPIKAAWPHGHVYGGSLTIQSAMYIAGYLTKKWTKENDRNRQELAGRRPEFSRSSVGIGARVAEEVARFYTTKIGCAELSHHGEVSSQLRMNGKMWPMDRYLMKKVREGIGLEGSGTSMPGYVSRLEGMQKIGRSAGHLVMDEFYKGELERARRSDATWKRVERAL